MLELEFFPLQQVLFWSHPHWCKKCVCRGEFRVCSNIVWYTSQSGHFKPIIMTVWTSMDHFSSYHSPDCVFHLLFTQIAALELKVFNIKTHEKYVLRTIACCIDSLIRKPVHRRPINVWSLRMWMMFTSCGCSMITVITIVLTAIKSLSRGR